MYYKGPKKTYKARLIHSAPCTDELNSIARNSGEIYSKTVAVAKAHWQDTGETIDPKDLRKQVREWMTENGIQCAGHSMQALVKEYHGALKSFFSRRKNASKGTNATARSPYKYKKFHTFTWRNSGIKPVDNTLRLSMGRKAKRISIPVGEKDYRGITPATVQMVYNKRKHRYDFIATYDIKPEEQRSEGKVVAVDMGEIHPIVDFDGGESSISNGRMLRSIVQYRHKFMARINQKLSRCKRGSRRWKCLKRTKRRVLAKIDNQIRDARHKITSRFVSAANVGMAQTIVLGDLKNIRKRMNFGKKTNQKVHAWAFGELARLIKYKAEDVGIRVTTKSEAYTSQTCPSCQNRKKPAGRTYKCRNCGWEGHRDVVGASNLWTKYQGTETNPVVGAVAPPLGIRFHWHLSRLDNHSRSVSGRLISKKPPRAEKKRKSIEKTPTKYCQPPRDLVLQEVAGEQLRFL